MVSDVFHSLQALVDDDKEENYMITTRLLYDHYVITNAPRASVGSALLLARDHDGLSWRGSGNAEGVGEIGSEALAPSGACGSACRGLAPPASSRHAAPPPPAEGRAAGGAAVAGGLSSPPPSPHHPEMQPLFHEGHVGRACNPPRTPASPARCCCGCGKCICGCGGGGCSRPLRRPPALLPFETVLGRERMRSCVEPNDTIRLKPPHRLASREGRDASAAVGSFVVLDG